MFDSTSRSSPLDYVSSETHITTAATFDNLVYSVQIVLFRWTKHTRVIIAMLRTLLRDTETQSRPTKLSKTFVRFFLELYGGKTYANVLQNNDHNTHFQVGRSKLLASSHGETGRRPNHAARIDKPGSDGDDERRHPSGTGCWRASRDLGRV